ncbi:MULTISPECIES: DinB family protein [unclassified Mucilaginibacter]|uniref:DinB family protein n=1 Tax=unclassified Mucilaginibacter TaxID=2617802 RepID=UPI0031F60B0F
MYHTISDFLTDWQNEAANTAKLFSYITEDAKAIKIHPKIRTLEFLAWHITETITEMGSKAGLFDDDLLEHQSIPATFAQIAAAHQKYNAQLAENVSSRLTDADLQDEVNMYGQTWTKSTVLSVLVQHEAHHRSQMTIIMRMVGLPVPGLYGPSQEEWEAMGMPAMP